MHHRAICESCRFWFFYGKKKQNIHVVISIESKIGTTSCSSRATQSMLPMSRWLLKVFKEGDKFSGQLDNLFTISSLIVQLWTISLKCRYAYSSDLKMCNLTITGRCIQFYFVGLSLSYFYQQTIVNSFNFCFFFFICLSRNNFSRPYKGERFFSFSPIQGEKKGIKILAELKKIKLWKL